MTGPAPGVLGRLGRLPLLLHVVALALVLLALVPLLDDGLFSADEGAALAQVDLIDRTGGWTEPNPAPAVDPERQALPLELAFVRDADDHWAPFHKHAAYIAALDAFDGAFGRTGPGLLSVLGTLVAAAGAGVLGRRLDPGIGALAVWVAGLGSPLLFDGYLVLAHTLGAGLAAWAAVLALASLEDARPARRAWAAALGAAVLLVGVGLVRSEGVLYGLAAGGGLAAASLTRSRPLRASLPGLARAALLGASGPVAFVAERVLDDRAWGGSGVTAYAAGGDSSQGFLSARVDGFTTTWLQPGYGGGAVVALTAIGVALLWASVVLVRRRADAGPVVVAALAGAALVALRLVAAPAVVPGLLVALPLLAGLAGLRRLDAQRVEVRVLAGTAALFAAAVLATQYASGGSGEWGGRYFALALPLAVPLALLGLRGIVATAPARAGRALVAAFAVATAVLAVSAVTSLRDAQQEASSVVARFAELRLEVGEGEPATVLTTAGTIARFSWADLDVGSWHTVAAGTLARYSERLAALGESVILFSADPAADVPVVEADWDVEPLAGTTSVFRLTPRGPGA